MLKVSAGGGSMKLKSIKLLILRLLRRRTTFPKFFLWIYRRQNETKYKTFWWPLSDNSSWKHGRRTGKYIELHANIISPCDQWKILAPSSTGERVNVTILGTKFGQSNEGGGSTGEGWGVGLERKEKTLLSPSPLPSPAQSLSLKPWSKTRCPPSSMIIWSPRYLVV